MILSLIGRNLRHQGRLLLALMLGFVLLESLIVAIASQIESGPGFRGLIEQFLPPAIREALLSQFGVASMSGMVAFGFHHPAVLTAALAFVIVVATLPAAERETGLIDLILSRPLRREIYLFAVVATLLVGVIVLPAALVAGAAAGLARLESDAALPWTRYLAPAAGLATLMLAVGGYTLLLAAGTKRRGAAVAYASGLTIALYLLGFLANLWEPIRMLRVLTPFHYFDPIRAAVIPHTPVRNPAVLLGIFAVGVLAALWRFRRQDL